VGQGGIQSQGNKNQTAEPASAVADEVPGSRILANPLCVTSGAMFLWPANHSPLKTPLSV
jgi:hypothetical protein